VQENAAGYNAATRTDAARCSNDRFDDAAKLT